MNKFVFIIISIAFLINLEMKAQEISSYESQKSIIESYFTNKGEIYFKFFVTSKNEINFLTKIISIDNVNGYEVYAYANREELNNFIKYNYRFEVLPHPGDVEEPRMSNDINQIKLDWDYYPTYDGYITMMYQFQTQFPDLCRIVDIGNTVQGRKLLFAVISDSINKRETEPQFLYTSTIHGDETTGYVLMLRLINYLLTEYGTNPYITYLVNNIEIWINPLANPDGTYHGGNNTVSGAIRYNANNKDLNRNFPDPAEGPNPGGAWQPETIAMMNIAKAKNFVASANFHGGAEVLNYPWDTWSRLTADNNWWIYICRQYADTVHKYAVSGYMTYLNNGITNGYAWYRITGGRQDYMNYFRRCREVTIEISNTKLLPASQLPAHWNYNYRSFLYHINKSLYGIRGIVTDSLTGNPIRAMISITGHDFDSSEVFSDSASGNYHRLIYTGTYSLTFSAPNYYSKTTPNIYTKNDSTTVLNVQLRPYPNNINISNIPADFTLEQNYPNPFNPYTSIRFQIPKNDLIRLSIFDITGKEVTKLIDGHRNAGNYEINWHPENQSSGIYICKLKMLSNNYIKSIKLTLIK